MINNSTPYPRIKSLRILGIRMRSGPRAKSMHLRCGQPSCAHACQLSIPDHDGHLHMYIHMHVHTYVRTL